MSRIGKLPVIIPEGVTVNVTPDNVVTVKGAKGELVKLIDKNIQITVEDKKVELNRSNDDKYVRALHGLSRSLVNNMVLGVSQGFQKSLELVGVGYRAQLKGKDLILNLGYSHPIDIKAIDGIKFEVPEPTKILVKGIDKELVGQIAAVIRSKRKPEPYKGKGIRYEGEYVRRKEGKTGK